MYLCVLWRKTIATARWESKYMRRIWKIDWERPYTRATGVHGRHWKWKDTAVKKRDRRREKGKDWGWEKSWLSWAVKTAFISNGIQHTAWLGHTQTHHRSAFIFPAYRLTLNIIYQNLEIYGYGKWGWACVRASGKTKLVDDGVERYYNIVWYGFGRIIFIRREATKVDFSHGSHNESKC